MLRPPIALLVYAKCIVADASYTRTRTPRYSCARIVNFALT